MNKIFLIAMMGIVCASGGFASERSHGFLDEIDRGVDMVTTKKVVKDAPDPAPGALGQEVYETSDAVTDGNMSAYVPSSMYVRMGGGLNLDFASGSAKLNDSMYKISDGYTVQLGLGWNMSSYVRTELGFQHMNFGFADLPDAKATSQSATAMLYFDLARRYVHKGDITQRRTFVPFFGVGASVGYYEFEGHDGVNGVTFGAPRAEVGFNIMLSDLIGFDVVYQYQLMTNRGFGWTGADSRATNISNVVASMRVNF